MLRPGTGCWGCAAWSPKKERHVMSAPVWSVRTPLVDQQIPEQAKELGINEDNVVKHLMPKDTVDGEFTTTRDPRGLRSPSRSRRPGCSRTAQRARPATTCGKPARAGLAELSPCRASDGIWAVCCSETGGPWVGACKHRACADCQRSRWSINSGPRRRTHRYQQIEADASGNGNYCYHFGGIDFRAAAGLPIRFRWGSHTGYGRKHPRPGGCRY